MAESWTNSPTAWPVDAPVHAGICRAVLQDNLQCVYENSGYFYDLASTEASWYAGTIWDTWIWYEAWRAIPIPVYRSQSGGWRSYTIEAELRYSVAPGGVGIYLLPTQARPLLNSVTGAVEGCSSYKFYNVTTTLTRISQKISLDRVGAEVVAGYQIPVVWIHIAGNSGAAGGHTLSVGGLSVEEGI